MRVPAPWARRPRVSVPQLIVDGMRDGLALHDRDGVLVLWNDAAQAVTGWTPVEAAFRVPSETRLVVVQVTRPAPSPLNDKTPGAAWIDSVALRRID